MYSSATAGVWRKAKKASVFKDPGVALSEFRTNLGQNW